MLKIYLDNCCYNRPFDIQEQDLIRLETQAKLAIQRKIKEGNIRLHGLLCRMRKMTKTHRKINAKQLSHGEMLPKNIVPHQMQYWQRVANL